jgi:hypothetical protein
MNGYFQDIVITEKVKAVDVPDKIIKQYSPADTFILFNEEDKVLKTIRVDLPPCPDIETIDGYGLPAREQRFKTQEYPPRLKRFEREWDSLMEIHRELERKEKDYKEEIEWIRLQWERREHGYWFFLNGKPTYLDGWHYFFLNFWKIDIGLPHYRQRDKMWFIFARYCYTDTFGYYSCRILLKESRWRYFDTIENLRKEYPDTRTMIVETGDYYIDFKRRICYGFNYPKHRREGATHRSVCVLYCIISSNTNFHGGIQSMDDTSAYKAFKKMISSWKKVPFFFKPIYDGSTDPETKIVFDVPAVRIGGKGSLLNINSGLESWIDFATTASRQFYDGDKLHVLYRDEEGKTLLEDVDARWDVNKKTLAEAGGIEIIGFTPGTSTVGEMSKKGGAAFKRLCARSMWHERDESGQTKSGLYNLFIPSHYCLQGFVDIFGNSISDDPSEEDLWRIPSPMRDASGKLMGSKRYLDIQLNKHLLSNSPDAMDKYEEEMRLNPPNFSSCFIAKGGSTGINLVIVSKRIQEIEFDRTLVRRGNLGWAGGVRDTQVLWQDDETLGRWYYSGSLDTNDKNKRYSKYMWEEGKQKVIYFPENPEPILVSGDPYKFRKTEGKRQSLGAITAFRRRDLMVDDDNKPIHEYLTHRFILTYEYRHQDPYDFAEDFLMTCVWLGALGYPEINIPLLWDYLVMRGYSGYLSYDKLPNGTYKKTPGYNSLGASQQKIFAKNQEYIENHGHRECHLNYLSQCKDIRGIEELTDYDIFLSAGGNLMGLDSDYFKNISRITNAKSVGVNDIFGKHRY